MQAWEMAIQFGQIYKINRLKQGRKEQIQVKKIETDCDIMFLKCC